MGNDMQQQQPQAGALVHVQAGAVQNAQTQQSQSHVPHGRGTSARKSFRGFDEGNADVEVEVFTYPAEVTEM